MKLKKDLLGIEELSAEEIDYILKNAETMRHIITQPNKKTPHLQGKSIVTLFYENSTRTRLSFELAAKYMSAAAANISASGSSVAKGENLLDTARTINRMGTDVLIIRHPIAGAPHLVAKNISAAVINAGDGMHEHPTQALLDMFTIKQHFGKIDGLKVAIIGDIAHSRVARSNIWGLTKMGAEVALGAPLTLMPKDIAGMGARVCKTVDEAIEGADAVMCLRMQLERQKSALFSTAAEYFEFFGVDKKRLSLAKKDALILHPGPVNRGIELSSYVADSENSVIDEQVENGVAVRMALLYLLTRSRDTINGVRE